MTFLHVTRLFILKKLIKSWKPECVLNFNMGWRILVSYPEPEESVTCTGARANEIIPNR